MPNLIESVGVDYFNRRFSGSYFLDQNDNPAIVVTAGGDATVATVLKGTSNRMMEDTAEIPNDYFTDLSKFSVPRLGWRTAAQGKYLVYMSRNNRSYHRGLSAGNLNVKLSPMTQWLVRSNNFRNTIGKNKQALLAMKPEFIPFAEGVEKMRRGEILSFAASHIVAVSPDVDEKFAIFFREKKVGEVLPNGTLSFTIPSVEEYLGEL